MGAVGSFDLNLDKLSNTTNNSILIGAEVTGAIADFGDLIGLAIAVFISMVLIFAAVFLVLGFIPKMIGKLKGIRGGVS